ncbi:MAG: histidine kinase [Clostridia bacterium]|nr:histidine kinase [Clostridia bacterium]
MKFGIRLKLTISFIAVILVMAIISLGFVSLFSESYILNDTQKKLGNDAKYFSEVLGAQGFFSSTDILLLFQRMNSINYSMIFLDKSGSLLMGQKNEFADAIKAKLSQPGAHIIKVNNEAYSVYIQEVNITETGELLGYVVPFITTKDYGVNNSWFVLFIFSILLAAFLAILIATYLSRRLTVNIRKLTTRADLLKNRKFDVSIPIKSNDEIGELAKSMETMADSIQEYDLGQKVFLQNASHELRTPLMSIRGYVEGIKDGVFNDTDKAYDLILSQVTRLERLVEEVLFLSKIETTEGIFKMEPIKIEDIVIEAIERVKGITTLNNIKIEKKDIPDVVVNVDGDKVATVFTNILSNCMRFAKNKIEINVSLKDNNIVISISDDGDGINPNDMPHLFDRFYKGQKGNHGLGLSIAKAIVTSHNGVISAHNKPNYTDPISGSEKCGGAVFDVLLPIKK